MIRLIEQLNRFFKNLLNKTILSNFFKCDSNKRILNRKQFRKVNKICKKNDKIMKLMRNFSKIVMSSHLNIYENLEGYEMHIVHTVHRLCI